jgi:hypothetical protein
MEKLNIEIVISRFNEDLKWTLKEPFCNFPITVYNKGINNDFEKKHVTRIYKLRNVGMCDHTYLYHIIYHYESLADITIFLPGSTNLPYKFNKASLIFELIKEHRKAMFIATYYKNGISKNLADFVMTEYAVTDENNKKLNSDFKLKTAKTRPFGKWYKKTFPNTECNYASYIGIFSISKLDIIKKSRDYYINLIPELELGTNLEVAHFFERSWITIFQPLTDTIIGVNMTIENFDNDDGDVEFSTANDMNLLYKKLDNKCDIGNVDIMLIITILYFMIINILKD